MTEAKRKICVVITARPSYSRIKTALEAIRDDQALELQLVVAASAVLTRYGNVMEQIVDDGFEITEKVFMVLEGQNPTSMAKTTGIGLLELATTFSNLKPDIVVTIADRYETIATAIAGAYMNIPVAHVQGGEVTGSIDEKVRHAVTKLSDIHLVASEAARERVIRMGENPAAVFCTGCPSVDLAAQVMSRPKLAFDPMQKYTGVGPKLDLSEGYVVVMQHPVTTEYEQSLRHVWQTLEAMDKQKLPVLWFWPNSDAGSDGTSSGIRQFREQGRDSRFHFYKNMSPHDFLRLLLDSRCLVGNSSVGVRECAFLGVPVVNIGTRQVGRDRGKNVIDADYDVEAISIAVAEQSEIGRYESDSIYGSGNAGVQIAKILREIPITNQKRLQF
ncbi:MAG: UDP-N-acetylglucosamine 2-epimerase (hydrolyzing) [Planctomycetes bacterium]|nr:UDP-N-acetylglucosamine 2-epimerase (hydrolyzing) [Planctomycetota bacterium]